MLQTDDMSAADDLEALHHSDQRTIRTVDSLTDDQWAEPSLLPGWTRAHVIAHLALNGEGFAGALEGLHDGEAVAIYPSQEARDAGIAELAEEDPSEIRDRFYASTEHFRRIAGSLTRDDWAGNVPRLPEGPAWPARRLVTSRRQELEIHHADLGVAYTPRDWPTEFTVTLIDRVTRAHAGAPDSPGFAVRAKDLNRTWNVGAASPVVSGAAGSLAWWLIGRGHGEGLSSPEGLPELGSWQREPEPKPQGR
ncbi:MAG: maleylpyruvate isomerase family mycothiol-dependent enzyme [Marmoricola sp.]|nr:maleylpyruvate isomerase family mycothiol-dependent enzyme [Marmoricola sp.]